MPDVTIEISEAMLARFAALPKKVQGMPLATFTAEQDAVILKYWDSDYRKSDVANSIGKCINVCRRRYEELTR